MKKTFECEVLFIISVVIISGVVLFLDQTIIPGFFWNNIRTFLWIGFACLAIGSLVELWKGRKQGAQRVIGCFALLSTGVFGMILLKMVP